MPGQSRPLLTYQGVHADYSDDEPRSAQTKFLAQEIVEDLESALEVQI